MLSYESDLFSLCCYFCCRVLGELASPIVCPSDKARHLFASICVMCQWVRLVFRCLLAFFLCVYYRLIAILYRGTSLIQTGNLIQRCSLREVLLYAMFS